MNEREQFEVWIVGEMDRGLSQLEVDQMSSAYQAGAESKQSELDKANARIAQLLASLRSITGNYEIDTAIINCALLESSDTWQSDHDKAVEVRVLEEVTAKLANGATLRDTSWIYDMIESRKQK